MELDIIKSEKGKETRASILIAARELFYKQGYKKTTTRQIADLSKTGLGSISYYFSSKAEIAYLIYRDIRDEMQDLLYQYYKEGTVLMFFMAMATEFHLLLNNENYRNFYLEIAYEEPILEYQRSTTDLIMKRYMNKTYKSEDQFILSFIGLIAIKPDIIREYAHGNYNFSSTSAIEYNIDQYIYTLGCDPSLGETVMSELNKYHIDIVENFTPAIIKIRT